MNGLRHHDNIRVWQRSDRRIEFDKLFALTDIISKYTSQSQAGTHGRIQMFSNRHRHSDNHYFPIRQIIRRAKIHRAHCGTIFLIPIPISLDRQTKRNLVLI